MHRAQREASYRALHCKNQLCYPSIVRLFIDHSSDPVNPSPRILFKIKSKTVQAIWVLFLNQHIIEKFLPLVAESGVKTFLL